MENPNLNLARKYEWNASMARAQGDTKEAERYESMSKMALIDAAQDMNRNHTNSMQSYDNTSYSYCSRASDGKDHTIAFCIGFFGGLALLLFLYISMSFI